MRLDNRQEAVTPHSTMGINRLIGLCLLHPNVAQAANALKVDVEPGEAIIDGHVGYMPGSEQLTCYSGSTLADGYEVISTVVCVYKAPVNGLFLAVVNGVAALTGSAVAPTEAEISASIGAAHSYLIVGDAKFSNASTVITVTLNRTRRSYELDPDRKALASIYTFDPLAKKSYYRRFQQWAVASLDAADIANGDLLTIPLPKIHGRIIGGRVTVEKAITTGSKTTAISGKIGSTAITGLALTFAGTKAIGVVTELSAATANNTFKPGDNFVLVFASTTAFVEGRVRFELDIDELQQ